jgi:hypothetical protein
MTRTTRRVLLAIVLGWLGASVLRAEEIIERYDDGKIKERYSTDAEGRKHGKYLAHHPNGKIAVRGQYKAGQLDGLQTYFWESGKVRLKAEYREGKLHGGYVETDEKGNLLKEQVFWNGQLLYPKSGRQISEMVNKIMGSFGVGASPSIRGNAPGDGRRPGGASALWSTEDAVAQAAGATDPLRDPTNLYALARLNAYRYLCDVPHDIKLTATQCDYARAAAQLCARLGHLEHYPTNPGLPEDQFKKAYYGTSHANLHQGGATRMSVDSFMEDSDPSNIAVVGHRRWCLNPSMVTTGFGECGVFSAMMVDSHDRKDVPDYDYICYPPRGLLPLDFFHYRHAWHVSVNPAHYAKPDPAAVKATVWPVRPGKSPTDADPERRAKEPLALDHFNVNLDGCGIPNAIIFRPVLPGAKAGDRFWVEITGLKKTDGSSATIAYIVEFMDL